MCPVLCMVIFVASRAASRWKLHVGFVEWLFGGK